MSGVVSAVGKVFKTVAKALPTILPVALGVGAVVLTGGAALGALPSWGTMVSGLVADMGAGSLLTSVLTGAVTQAGYGAAIGAATSLISGGDPLKGAAQGAMGGAVTGGLLSGLGGATDILGGLGKTATAAGAASETANAGTLGVSPADELAAYQGAQAPSTGVGPLGTGAVAPSATAAPAVAPAAAPGAAAAPGWLERNQTLVGTTVAGLGGGLLRGAATDAGAKSLLDREKMRQDYMRSNYATSGAGLLTQENMAYMNDQPARPTPAERFDPSVPNGQYVYDQRAGRIVFVPNQAKA